MFERISGHSQYKYVERCYRAGIFLLFSGLDCSPSLNQARYQKFAGSLDITKYVLLLFI